MTLIELTKTLVKGLLAVFGIGYYVDTRITKHKFPKKLGEKQTLLGRNKNRIFYRCYNNSSNVVYLADSNDPAGPDHYTTQISDQSEEISVSGGFIPYRGEVTFNPAVAGDGHLMVTEYVLVKNR